MVNLMVNTDSVMLSCTNCFFFFCGCSYYKNDFKKII